ncbi:serine hydrolase domain-containing protein [uncultured Dokdonia sp.]|uniref:serine hydrolase domain-containing protein n=1 Tax=uncultured Dokdonia sp. TaxID=575653 RepID=UPI00262C7731|nr:serine hydrolase domain-containing protein [uncultured Dokdonia sp.]
MKSQITLILLFTLLLNSCKEEEKKEVFVTTSTDTFTSEINHLKEYFQIPGLAILIKKGDTTIHEGYLGYATITDSIALDKTTTIPMASLTKIFSGIVIMQLEEERKLSLDDPINKYLPDMGVPETIKIKHILSHTSQGEVGKHFYYSSRFGILTPIIEKAAGYPFEDAIQKRIINKLQLTNTYLLKDSLQINSENRKIAAPYFLGGDMKDGFFLKETRGGFIDYGFSASAGITSTVHDLGVLSDALDSNTLISKASKEKIMTPFANDSPYGLGIFTQEFLGEQLIWGYGQYDCYSSLLLKVPSKNLTFIIAANNNLMSDPARLINGDITTSLFAMSFLKNYVYHFNNMPLFENANSLASLKDKIKGAKKEFYRQKLIAQASAEAYMTRFDSRSGDNSKAILKEYFKLFPMNETSSNLTILFNLQFHKTIASMREEPEFTAFDTEYKKIGSQLLSIDTHNPYANYYMANYYQTKNNIDSTTYFYKKVVDADNFSPWWYTQEAQQWLESQN